MALVTVPQYRDRLSQTYCLNQLGLEGTLVPSVTMSVCLTGSLFSRRRPESVDDGESSDATLRSSLHRLHQQARQNGWRRLQVVRRSSKGALLV